MVENDLKMILEAVLLTATQPLSCDKLLEIFEEWQRPNKAKILQTLHELQQDYTHRAFELIEVATGFRIQTRKEYAFWVGRLQLEKPGKYSRALLETLAIIAYKQPVTRADIEEVRGVAVNSQIIKTLLEREWIRIAGYKDVPGKPAVFTTTREFLNYFNLKSLNELPSLPEVMETLMLNNSIEEECNEQ